jgi:hypothetical protein
MMPGGEYCALSGLAFGLALAGCAIQSAAAENRCDLGYFQGEWTAVENHEDHIIVTQGEIMVKAGSATTHLVLRPERDLGEPTLAEVQANMRQIASLYPAAIAALGGAAARLCWLRVATPGGQLALLTADGGLLWLEEARGDAPVVQRLRRGEIPRVAGPPLDYLQPPR